MSFQRSQAKGDNFKKLSLTHYKTIAKIHSNDELARLLNSDDDSTPNIVLDTLSDSSKSGSCKSKNSSNADRSGRVGLSDCTADSDDGLGIAECSIDSGDGNKSDQDPGELEVIPDTQDSSSEDSDELESILAAQNDGSERLIDSEDSGDDFESNNDADNEISSHMDSSASEKSSTLDSEDDTEVKRVEDEALLSDRSERSQSRSEEGSVLRSNASSPIRSEEYSIDDRSSKFDSDEETTLQHDLHEDLVDCYNNSVYEKSSEDSSSEKRSLSDDEILAYEAGNDQRLSEDVNEVESSDSDVEAFITVKKSEEKVNGKVDKAIHQLKGENRSFNYCSNSDEEYPLDEESLKIVMSDEDSEGERIRSDKGSGNERKESTSESENERESSKGSDNDSRWSDCDSEEELIQTKEEDEAECASDGNLSDEMHGSRSDVFQTNEASVKKELENVDNSSYEVEHYGKSATELVKISRPTEIGETSNPTQLEKTESTLELLPVDSGSASDSDDREVIGSFFQSSGDEGDNTDSEHDGDRVEGKNEKTMNKLDRMLGRTMRRPKEFTGNKYRSPEH